MISMTLNVFRMMPPADSPLPFAESNSKQPKRNPGAAAAPGFCISDNPKLAGAAGLDDHAAARQLNTLPNRSALGVMAPPAFAMTHSITIAIAFMNGYAAFAGTNNNSAESRKGSHNRCGNRRAQNKQTHL